MTEANKEACHVFRFFRRDAQHTGGLGARTTTAESIFDEEEADSSDEDKIKLETTSDVLSYLEDHEQFEASGSQTRR